MLGFYIQLTIPYGLEYYLHNYTKLYDLLQDILEGSPAEKDTLEYLQACKACLRHVDDRHYMYNIDLVEFWLNDYRDPEIVNKLKENNR